MEIEALEQAIFREISVHGSADEGVDVLLPSGYECRYAIGAIRKHFPTLEVGVPLAELAHLGGEWSGICAGSFRPVMVGSVGGICADYLRARFIQRSDVARFKAATALIVNYADNAASVDCIIVDENNKTVCSIHFGAFLSLYKRRSYVNVQLRPPPTGLRWDFENRRPI